MKKRKKSFEGYMGKNWDKEFTKEILFDTWQSYNDLCMYDKAEEKNDVLVRITIEEIS